MLLKAFAAVAALLIGLPGAAAAQALEHDAIGGNCPTAESCSRFIELERIAGGKPVSTFPQPALEDKPVTHGPLQPEVEVKVREFVLNRASDFGGFYPDAQFRNVHAVWFESGSIIVCGEIDKPLRSGRRSGWRYFTNSGPLIYESDRLEVLCDRRSYAQPGFSDDTEYGPDFTKAAVSGLRTPAAYSLP